MLYCRYENNSSPFLQYGFARRRPLSPYSNCAYALRADEKTARSYHDKKHNDDHEWNAHEDQAYRVYAKENHRKYRDFSRLNDNDQQAYWGWRHEHSDALLKIDIR